MRLEIHVRPNSSGTHVGGSHAGALVVRVTAPPDRGRATAAALDAVADALSVPDRTVTLVRGGTSRRKVVEVAVAEDRQPEIRARLERLMSAGRG